MNENKITIRFVLYLLVTILSVYIFFSFKFLKPVYYWIDNPLHLAGGFWVGALSLWFLERYKEGLFLKNGFLVPFLIILGMAAFVGIGWETLEFIYDQAIGNIHGGDLISQPNVADTMKDLINDLLGGLLFCLAFLFRKKS